MKRLLSSLASFARLPGPGRLGRLVRRDHSSRRDHSARRDHPVRLPGPARFAALAVFCAFLAGCAIFHSDPQTSAEDDGTRAEIEAALEQALDAAVGRAPEDAPEAGLAMLVFDVEIDRLQVSSEGEWAVLWLAGYDKETGEPAGMEPWLAIGRVVNGEWEVHLPTDPDFSRLLALVPGKLLTEDDRRILGDGPSFNCDTSAMGPFGGYKLPWAAGQTLFLTQSIYHTVGWGYNPTFSMIHAFDFSTSPSGLFEIRAARPGTVKYVWDGQPNNDPSEPGNYIVLEDTGTNPTSYQLYLHLAQGSIPAALKTTGTPVQQGQKLAIADDTGASTNHHLHFQVHTEVSWWGCSVDVQFSDVPINGGRPRLPIEAQNYPQYGAQGQTTYTSQNTAPPTNQNPPGGGVTSHSPGQIVASGQVQFSGYAYDFLVGVTQAQFAYNNGGGWETLGAPQAFSAGPGVVYFNASVDLCAAGVPDGPLTVGIRAVNAGGDVLEGGLAVPVILNANCAPPPPACQPAAGEVALFELPNYAGACTLLPVGEHVQPLTARSLRVGSDVAVTLYLSPLLRARSQTFFENDPNLSDDRAALDSFGSARVRLKSTVPGVPLPAWPAAGQALPLESSFSLVWHDGGGSAGFQVSLDGPGGNQISPWVGEPYWDPGALATGSYTWEVRAQNPSGISEWSASGAFTVQAAQFTVPPEVTAPFIEDFESGINGWTATGFWNRLNDSSAAFNGLFSWWYGFPAGDFDNGEYNNGSPNTGSLTSPPILIPAEGFYMRYYSRYQTEGSGLHWDRRRVLISADGGPFLEIHRHSEELSDKWRHSAYFDLGAYAGQTIRVRFVFETMDAQFNDFRGWQIDQLTIDQSDPPSCAAENEPDSTPADATPIVLGTVYEAELCPEGDVDYFTFSGNAGELLQLDINAQTIGSALDAYAFLLSADGTSIVAENDDEVPAVLIDPLLGAVLPETGTYYIKVRAYDHPSQGGNAYFYTLKIELDSADPAINTLTPSVPLDQISQLPPLVTLTASASDSGSGVASVSFYYHDSDWGGSDWVLLGVDTNGTNGWSAGWDTVVHPAETGMALMAVAVDGAGNLAVVGLWDLFPLPLSIYLPQINR